MAKKESTKNSLAIVGVKPSSIAMFEGVLASLIGLFAAILLSLRATVGITQETSSVLVGMTFGISVGIVAIIVVPLI